MNQPQVKPFSQALEAEFPEIESVPENMRDWWVETKENLDRLNDKITTIESNLQTLSNRMTSILERLPHE